LIGLDCGGAYPLGYATFPPDEDRLPSVDILPND
jgi:hypothetical protein